VVEIASILAGPSVGMFFSELGSEVIKIENKKTDGDVIRSWKLPSEEKSSKISAYYCSVNWHKKSILLDLTNLTHLIEVKRHIESADVVILNFKKGDDLKFGLDYHSLSIKNPKLIYGSINGFGEESDRVAFDLILQAESGFMSMNGTPSSGPVKMPVALIDILAGHQLKEGILVALIERLQSGKGKKIAVSLYDSAISSLANQATNWLMEQHIAKPLGSIHPNISPYGELFTTKDSDLITFAIGSNKQFLHLCEVLKIKDIHKDDLYATNSSRVINRESLESILKVEVAKYNSSELLNSLHSKFVPVAKIKTIDEVFEMPEAQKMILREVIDGIETSRVKTIVF
jgi:crotonobetainyl-CoA:carnitine CoA-transferase CaiB-like acyl-CoA transferase